MNETENAESRAALRQARRANLARCLRPRRIAFVGGGHLERCIQTCRDMGFDGAIDVVNPVRGHLGGIACAPSIGALAQAPDAAFVALSRERSIAAIAELAAAGAGGAVCHVAGFAELGGEHRQAQDALAQAAGTLAVIGPNCMGFFNAFDRLALWGEYTPVETVDGGGVALISQSGAFLYGIAAVEQAYPMGYGISVGNQAVIDTTDLIDAALDDPRVRVIGLYIEGLPDTALLARALARAVAQAVPVVLLRGGGTPAAAERSLSHTGNLALPNDFWQALIERYGVIRVASPKQLIETTKLLAVAGAPAGPRIFVGTYSGAAGTLLAEQAPERGLELTPVAPDNAAAIRPTLPEIITISNPLDLNLPWKSDSGVSMDDGASIARCLADASRGTTDALVFMFDVPRRGSGGDEPWLATFDALIALKAMTGLPTIASGLLPEGIEAHHRRRLQSAGVAATMGFSETLDALGHAAAWSGRQRALADDPPRPPGQHGAPSGARACDEWTSKQMLVAYGLAFPAGWCGAAEDAAAAAGALGYPVAVKLVSTTLLHKNRVGGVRLGIGDAQGVADAVAAIARDVERHAPGYGAATVLVERMVAAPVAEVLIGIKRHAQLGLALVIGRGGVAVEQLRDYALVLLPASGRELESAIARLLLPAACMPALIRAARAVEAFALDHGGSLVELDVNPVLVCADGSAVAADALVVLGTDEKEEP
jgi:acetate---CoA ligase (ADP-forming)